MKRMTQSKLEMIESSILAEEEKIKRRTGSEDVLIVVSLHHHLLSILGYKTHYPVQLGGSISPRKRLEETVCAPIATTNKGE